MWDTLRPFVSWLGSSAFGMWLGQSPVRIAGLFVMHLAGLTLFLGATLVISLRLFGLGFRSGSSAQLTREVEGNTDPQANHGGERRIAGADMQEDRAEQQRQRQTGQADEEARACALPAAQGLRQPSQGYAQRQGKQQRQGHAGRQRLADDKLLECIGEVLQGIGPGQLEQRSRGRAGQPWPMLAQQSARFQQGCSHRESDTFYIVVAAMIIPACLRRADK